VCVCVHKCLSVCLSASISQEPCTRPNFTKIVMHVAFDRGSVLTSSIRSLHWLKVTERIEYKFLSLSSHLSAVPHLHLIPVQPPRSIRSPFLNYHSHTSTYAYIRPSLRISRNMIVPFSARVVNIWNNLTNSVVNASTVRPNAFKARLDYRPKFR